MERRNGILAAAILGSSMVFIDLTVVNTERQTLEAEVEIRAARRSFFPHGGKFQRSLSKTDKM